MKSLKYLANSFVVNVKAIKKILAMLFIVMLSSYSFGSFEKAMKVYAAGHFAEAKEAFEALAEVGDRPSLFNLGVMYYRGEVGERDPLTAYALMKMANDGSENKYFSDVIASLLTSFTAVQVEQAESRYIELEPIYSINKINEKIFPIPLDDADCPPELQPIKKIAPSYPWKENKSLRMGITQAEYTISPNGYPRDITIVSSTSKGFSKSTISAIKRWLYKPTIDGEPIYGHRMRVIFSFDTKDVRSVKTQQLAKELEELEVSASAGDVIAQFTYGSRLNTFRYFKDHFQRLDLQYRTANDWFTKSAKGGFPIAQFEIGRNMIEGRGCKVDKVNGYKWVKAAALGGLPAAQKMVAQAALVASDVPDKQAMAAVNWLRSAVRSGDYPSRLLLAWELATSDEAALRDGSEALALLAQEKPYSYADDVRVYETKAAAYAESGDFKKAIKFQEKAIDEAEDNDWNIPMLALRLAFYKNKKPYRGAYF